MVEILISEIKAETISFQILLTIFISDQFYKKTTAVLNDKEKNTKNTTLVNLTQFNDKLIYLHDLN